MTIPSQTEVKAVLSEFVSHGARKRIALRLGINESDLSRRFSVNDERKSGLGEGLRELLAIAAEDPQAFQSLKTFLQSILKQHKIAAASMPANLLVCKADKEADDVIRAWAENRPTHVQVRETVEAIVAMQRWLVTLVARKGSQVAVQRKSQRLRKTG